jgi:serine/threonine-protein kinase
VSATQDPDRPLERIGEYEVLALISEGGMGRVVLGRSAADPRLLVALKVIRAEYARDKSFLEMFEDEARIASRLVHPHIVAVRGAGHDGSRHFLAMELLRGHTVLETWRSAHARGKRLPLEVVAWIGARVADALHYAHELRDEAGEPLHVVHRDVNPANVLLTRDGVPKVIDFGLAKTRDRVASTAFGVVKGKVAYLAPEQALGHPADRRSDVFALGVMLWELTLDRRLFRDESDVETLRRVREAEIPHPATQLEGYPPPLADALMRALARDPERRWQTAADLRDALDAYVAGTGRQVDASGVRELLREAFGEAAALPWERTLDEALAGQEPTRIWEGAAAPHPEGRDPLRGRPVAALLVAAAACGALGGLAGGVAARGCGRDDAAARLETRLARVEDLLGLVDAGPPAPPAAASRGAAGAVEGSAAAPVSADDLSGPCAVARVNGYRTWQEAFARARATATPAEAACADLWGERKRQACYQAATAGVRAIQAARDALMAGGPGAREAVKAVKDDPKNDAIARARAASDAVFVACKDVTN